MSLPDWKQSILDDFSVKLHKIWLDQTMKEAKMIADIVDMNETSTGLFLYAKTARMAHVASIIQLQKVGVDLSLEESTELFKRDYKEALKAFAAKR